MAHTEKGLRNQLGSIREAFLLKLSDRMKESEEKWNSIAEKALDAMDTHDLVEFHRMIHSLAGSSAVFGLKSLSGAARELERLLRSVIDAECLINEATRGKISDYLPELRRLCSSGLDAGGPLPDFSVHSSIPPAILAEVREKKLIYLIDDEPLQLESMAVQIAHFGYSVRCFSILDEAVKAIMEDSPSAVIMDIVFPEGSLAGVEAIAEIRKRHGKNWPAIFISTRSDFKARLNAVRAGGDAYFIKPVHILEIIEKLDSLTIGDEPAPYRILIVDDDPVLSSLFSSVLEEAGMTTFAVNDPLQAMDHLIEFKPDLILTDMYMPGCTGEELASVIRQVHAYVSIPIVYLSSETNVDTHLKAMRVGGDDFLTKPIQPRHLISSISIRAERMRIMRSLMEKDGLTGLLNHTNILGQLELAIERAVRHRSTFTFAMIDLDRFKSVNDTYGHPAGDRVLNSLARILQQRLRKSDLVGRYGGEEFAVVLLGTAPEPAAKVLDDIRESFSKVVHQCESREFNVTFSAGLAAFPRFPDLASLIEAADAALYKSKSKGRNRLTVA